MKHLLFLFVLLMSVMVAYPAVTCEEPDTDSEDEFFLQIGIRSE